MFIAEKKKLEEKKQSSMKKRNKNGNLPNLRFKEFENSEWEETDLGSILEIGSGKDYKHLKEGDIPVFGTGGHMTSVNGYLFDGESVCIGRKGTINKPFYFHGKFWTVDTLFYTHSYKNIFPKFLFYTFEQINWLKYNEASGVPSLSKSTIESIIISIPALPEQEKIAKFLTLIDERISTQNKIIEKHESLIKGLSKSLYCLNNRSVPKLRFPEYNTPWQKVRLDSLGDFSGGGTPDSTNSSYWKGNIPWISSSDLEGNNIRKINISRYITENAIAHSTTKICHPPTIMIVSRVGVGKVAYSDIPICTSQDFINFHNIKCNIVFMTYLLLNLMERKVNEAQGTSIKGIASTDIKSMLVDVSDLAEQNKIASVLDSFFTKLTIEKNILISLQEQKKYLLRNLFI
jgi:type I restriction enzyme S subunit